MRGRGSQVALSGARVELKRVITGPGPTDRHHLARFARSPGTMAGEGKP